TPPRASERTAWREAFGLLRHPFVLVLWLVAFVDSFVHNCFFNWTGVFLGSDKVGIASNWIMPVMSIGQVAEILTMLVLGGVLKKLGWRWTMVVGVLGHAARFAVFAYLPEHAGLVVAVNILHGVCYAFFFATVYIFVDAYLPQDIRSSAQGLFNLMILGGGALLANSICPWLINEVYKTGEVIDFRGLFELPLFTAVGAAVMLAVAFWPPAKPVNPAAAPAAH
ncbi:MAG: MFS transporter, partial [Planctomycetes bacterium]|nr:MFS transporter [Planctomycetota bacterium]